MKTFPAIIAVLMPLLFGVVGCGPAAQIAFDPSTRAAFIYPDGVTPLSAIQRDPQRIIGQYVKIAGTVTEIAPSFIVIDSYVKAKTKEDPTLLSRQVGQRIQLRGKLAKAGLGNQLELRYARSYLDLH